MNPPQSLSKQRFARCRGELHRGCGVWPKCWSNGQLEPPFEPFSLSNITRWDLGVNGFDAPYQGQFADRLKRLFHQRASAIGRTVLFRRLVSGR